MEFEKNMGYRYRTEYTIKRLVFVFMNWFFPVIFSCFLTKDVGVSSLLLGHLEIPNLRHSLEDLLRINPKKQSISEKNPPVQEKQDPSVDMSTKTQDEREILFDSFMNITKSISKTQSVLFETAYGYHATSDFYDGYYFQYPHLTGTLFLWNENLGLFESIDPLIAGQSLSEGQSNSVGLSGKNSRTFNNNRQNSSDMFPVRSVQGDSEGDTKDDEDISREERNRLKKEQSKEEWEKLQIEEKEKKRAAIEQAINDAFVEFDDETYQEEQIWKRANLERYFQSVDDIVICTVTSQRLYNSELSLDIVAEIEVEKYLHGEGDQFRTIHVPYVNPYIEGRPETVPPTVVETYTMLIFIDRFNRVVEGNGLFVIEGNHAFRNKKPNLFINPRLDRDWSAEMPFDEYVIYSIAEVEEFITAQNNSPKIKKILRRILR